MRIADLVDLECLLREASAGAADSGASRGSASGAERRNRAAVQQVLEARGVGPDEARARVQADASLRRAVFEAWIATERRHRHAGDPHTGETLPGGRVESTLGWTGGGLFVVGLLVGGSSAGALLHYDGTLPVNVLWFAAVFIGLQLLLLGFTLWFVLRRSAGGGVTSPGFVHLGVAALLRRFLGDRGTRLAGLMEGLRARHGAHARLETWTLFGLTQRFGVAFNLGALVACLVLVAVSDLVFAWSSTLEIEAATAHTITEALAVPWSWLVPEASPELAAVEASRWSRMQGAFVGNTTQAEAERLAAGWWQFLVAGVLVYGLLPRGCAWWFGASRARALRRGLGFDDGVSLQALDHLLPRSGWDAPRPDEVRGAAPAQRVDPTTQRPMPTAEAGAPAGFFAWGSFPAAVLADLAARLALRPVVAVPVGGSDLAEDDAALAALRGAAAGRAVLAVDAGQQPTKDALRFLAELRAALGGGLPLSVVLVERGTSGSAPLHDADPEERAVWRRSLGSLGDPHLWVQELGT